MAEAAFGPVSKETVEAIHELLTKEMYPCGTSYIEGEFVLILALRKDSELDAKPVLDRAVAELKEQSHNLP